MTTTTEPTAAAEWALLLACEPLPTAWEAMQAVDMVMERHGCERSDAVRMLHEAAMSNIAPLHPTESVSTSYTAELVRACRYDTAEEHVRNELKPIGHFHRFACAAERAVAVLRVVQEVANG